MSADEWNEKHPIGTVVNAWPGTRDGAGIRTKTRSLAWELGDGTPVVAVKGYPGGISLAHVEIVASDITFRELSEKSQSRRDRWHTPDTEPWTGADWGNAMGGECGEAQNVVKKLRRHETGTAGPNDPPVEALIDMLADELGDVVAYADLLGRHYGIDLGEAVARKFNRVSEREGFPERVGEAL